MKTQREPNFFRYGITCFDTRTVRKKSGTSNVPWDLPSLEIPVSHYNIQHTEYSASLSGSEKLGLPGALVFSCLKRQIKGKFEY